VGPQRRPLANARRVRRALADLPDQKGWRINPGADYGPLNTFARGKTDLARIRRNWEDILRVVASIYTGTVRACDVVAMLQRDGHPTALGEGIAACGRIFKSLHILNYIDVDESYRRDVKGIRNLQEGRHALARTPRAGNRHRSPADRFMGAFQPSTRMQQPMKHGWR
jgi:TnpA family transposase